MQDRPPNRSTFLTLHDVLALGRQHVAEARPCLIAPMRQAGPDERTAMFLDWLDRQRVELEQAIDLCPAEYPESLLETRLQYIVQPWQKAPSPPLVATSIEALIESILKLDRPVCTTFRDLSERASRSDARELFARLADLMEAHHQGLSRQLQAARDV
jgi:hypothetical protein